MKKQYSPPNRAYPQQLPDVWRFEDGTIRTDLQELSDEELNALGWHGPIEMPSSESCFAYENKWNEETLSFDYIELDLFEKERRVNYIFFWQFLLHGSLGSNNPGFNGPVYTRIKNECKKSLEVNTVVTELIALIGDAKSGNAFVEKIQNSITEIMNLIEFTEDELKEFQKIFKICGMINVYTI